MEDLEKAREMFSSWQKQKEEKDNEDLMTDSNMAREEKTVSQLTYEIKASIKKQFYNLAIIGEITQKKESTKGQCYFVLVDNDSRLSCVMFKEVYKAYQKDRDIKEGHLVRCVGDVDVYVKRGSYQLIVKSLIDLDEGEIERRYRELKEKLRKEGLLDEAKKKPIPLGVNKIGLVTSIHGSVIHDFISTLELAPDYFSFHVDVYNVSVMDNEVRKIAQTISEADKGGNDVIVITRGGGGKDELAVWNEEEIIRACVRCKTPIISAIGHQDDFVLLDEVADMRAATATQAAGLIESKKHNLYRQFFDCQRSIQQMVQNRLLSMQYDLTNYKLTRWSRSLSAKLERMRGQFSSLQESLISKVNGVLLKLRDDISLDKQKLLVRRMDILIATKKSNFHDTYLLLLNQFYYRLEKTTKRGQLSSLQESLISKANGVLLKLRDDISPDKQKLLLRRMDILIATKKSNFHDTYLLLLNRFYYRLQKTTKEIQRMQKKWESQVPQALRSGYAVVMDENKRVQTTKNFPVGKKLKIVMLDDRRRAELLD